MATQVIGASTYSYLWTETAETAISKISGLGFDRVDLLMLPPHLWPNDLDNAARRSLRSALVGNGISVESINLPTLDQNLASPIGECRDFTVKQLATLLDFGSDLGARYLIVFPGRKAALNPPPDSLLLAWARASLDKVSAYAERCGIRLLLENHPHSLLPRASDMVSFLETVESSNIGVCYDVANGEFAGDDHQQAIECCAKLLEQVHLSDAKRDLFRHDPIGHGTVDFKLAGDCLRRIGYSGTSVLEIISVNPERDLRTSRERLIEFGWQLPEISQYPKE